MLTNEGVDDVMSGVGEVSATCDSVTESDALYYSADSDVSVLSAFDAPAARSIASPPMDGLWVLTAESREQAPEVVAPWLAQFEIKGEQVIDGQGAVLTLRRCKGQTKLAGGILTFDGLHLQRVGKTGTLLTFARAGW